MHIFVSLSDWFATLWAGVGAALPIATEPDREGGGTDSGVDPDFEGWVNNNPMVTGNPASRYGDDAPGYLTGNGLGSLEIGAADD